MRVIADLHLHSRFSRACSTQLNIDNIEKWAKIKGLDLVGTSDFSHPEWIKELKEKLTEDEHGILRTKSGFPFILQNEISLMYTQGKGRRVHLLILAPSFSIADKITKYLLTKGRVDYDGRPIFKLSCEEFVREMRKISEEIEVIPAHVWTPWFGLFGSKTGFDSVKEAFGDQAEHIHALETGMSSNPEMNYRLSKLDKYNLVSFSDSHSFWPWRIGREATVFELDKLTYNGIIKAIRTGKGIVETIEVDPNYGKYHFDGHRSCNVSFSPEESKQHKNICPVCKKPLTIGVLYRVDELADREKGAKPDGKPFKTLIPLHELISLHIGVGLSAKKVWDVYYKVLCAGKNELDILLNISEEKLLEVADSGLVDLIVKNRIGKILVKAGYDGEYGVPMIDVSQESSEKENNKKMRVPLKLHSQKGLNDFI